MTRRDIVLAALAAAAAGEGATFSPVQIQKLFFLIDRQIADRVNGPHFAFRPYDYGPFDSEVYDFLESLSVEDLVQIIEGRYRLYALTPRGFAEGWHILSSLPPETAKFLRDTAHWVRSISFQQLVSAIYSAYPDMKVNSIFRG